jgi:hypothetical protein
MTYTSGLSANLDNIQPGDTLYYKVSNFNLPLADLIPASETPIDLSQVQLDLTGSTVGIKVMSENVTGGTFLINSFVILNKAIVIPFPADTPSNITEIFGDSLNIPSGVGLGLGANIPGSDFINLLADNNSEPMGLPIYIEPSRTSEYQTLFQSNMNLDQNTTLVVTDGTDFQAKITTDQTNLTGSITLSWFKSGSNAGLFKEFTVSLTGVNDNGDSVNIAMSLSFDRRENLPLPTEIKNKQTQTLSVENSGFDLSFSGFFNDLLTLNETAYNDARSKIIGLKGSDLLRYQFNDVQGMYYNTSLYTKNLDTNSFENTGSSWFNGFTGFPTEYDTKCLTCNTDFFTLAITPFFAPGITPDWAMWQGTMNTITGLSSFVTSALLASSNVNNLLTYGVNIDQLVLLTQLRQASGFKYFYGQGDVKLNYDGSQAELSNRPSFADGTTTGSIDVHSNAYTSYTDTGLIAGYSIALNASINLHNAKIYENASYYDGSISLGLLLKLKNNAFSTVPDGKTATPVVGSLLTQTSSSTVVSDTSNTTNVITSPGFELIPVFMFIATCVFIRKSKK